MTRRRSLAIRRPHASGRRCSTSALPNPNRSGHPNRGPRPVRPCRRSLATAARDCGRPSRPPSIACGSHRSTLHRSTAHLADRPASPPAIPGRRRLARRLQPRRPSDFGATPADHVGRPQLTPRLLPGNRTRRRPRHSPRGGGETACDAVTRPIPRRMPLHAMTANRRDRGRNHAPDRTQTPRCLSLSSRRSLSRRLGRSQRHRRRLRGRHQNRGATRTPPRHPTRSRPPDAGREPRQSTDPTKTQRMTPDRGWPLPHRCPTDHPPHCHRRRRSQATPTHRPFRPGPARPAPGRRLPHQRRSSRLIDLRQGSTSRRQNSASRGE